MMPMSQSGLTVFDVGERRAVELDIFEQREQPLVDVEEATCGSRKQPASEVVATLSFFGSLISRCPPSPGFVANRGLVVGALADRHGEAARLGG